MTPELPRAPISAPRESFSAMTAAESSSESAISLVAARIVSDMLVPVSPSGTGKTLSALMASRCCSSQAWPARIAFLRSCPLKTLVCFWRGRAKREKKFPAITIAGAGAPSPSVSLSVNDARLERDRPVGERGDRGVASSGRHPQRLDVDVDAYDTQTQGSLDSELDVLHDVAGDLGDAQAMFEHDVELDGDVVLGEAHQDATIVLLGRQQLDGAEARAPCRDADHAVAFGHRATRNSANRAWRHLDLALPAGNHWARGRHGSIGGRRPRGGCRAAAHTWHAETCLENGSEH